MKIEQSDRLNGLALQLDLCQLQHIESCYNVGTHDDAATTDEAWTDGFDDGLWLMDKFIDACRDELTKSQTDFAIFKLMPMFRIWEVKSSYEEDGERFFFFAKSEDEIVARLVAAGAVEEKE